MIWGYPYIWKHPMLNTSWSCWRNSHWTVGTWAQVLYCQPCEAVKCHFHLSKWPAPWSWLVLCCCAVGHSSLPSCQPQAAPMHLPLPHTLEELQQHWLRLLWWHHRQRSQMRALSGSLLCLPLALASPLAWLQLVQVSAKVLLLVGALMVSPVSLRLPMTFVVCFCCPWPSWSLWPFTAWSLPWSYSLPTHSSSERCEMPESDSWLRI